MTPDEFVQGLKDGGMPFADQRPDYCPIHGWDGPAEDTYHHTTCDGYAQHLRGLGVLHD